MPTVVMVKQTRKCPDCGAALKNSDAVGRSTACWKCGSRAAQRGTGLRTTRQVAEQRAERIRANTKVRFRLVAEGLEAGDWRVLGFASPAAWYAALTDFTVASPEVRKRLVEALRAEGYSLRGIATELDVSKSTVERDLTQVSHDGTPDRVNGADGKTYPASIPKTSGPETNPVTSTPAQIRSSIAYLDHALAIARRAAGGTVQPAEHKPHCHTCTCYDDD